MSWTKLAVSLGVLLLAPFPARADFWASNGAGCTPGDPAIQSNRYFITAGSVHYKAGASGLITLYCPVNPNPIVYFDGSEFVTAPWCPLAYTLRLTYTDSDGAGNEVSVTSQLLRLSKQNGAFLGAVPGVQLRSNFSNVTVPTSLSTLRFQHDFDLSNVYYYVRVDMNRAAGSSHIATFYGVALACSA